MAKSILIIGAGIGGLATGCYALMNGYRARILEMHSGPGGVCTSWRRNGYTFDGCIHNLSGTTPNSAFQQIWRELGVVPALRMHAYKELVSLDHPDGGAPFVWSADLDQLEAEMKRRFPDDSGTIVGLIDAARAFRRFDVTALSLEPPTERAKVIAQALPLLVRGMPTLEDYAKRFASPFLRRMFPSLIYDWPQQNLFMALHFMARLHEGDLGWPMGGSAALAHAIEQRFKGLGGEIRYGARVRSVLVEKDCAVGVRLEDGSEEFADIVVSNAYGPTTIFEMLGGAYTNRAIEKRYRTPEDRIEMGVHVSLGVSRDLSHEPHAIVLALEKPAEIDGAFRSRLYVQTFGFDPTLAPAGKSVIKVLLSTSWKRWEAFAATPDVYRTVQDRVAERVIGLLGKRFPGVEKQIEAIDLATPMTTKRFTGNGVGFRVTPTDLALGLMTGRRLSRTLPGLASFYMVGQWAGVPGVPMVAAMGREIVRLICKRDGLSFAVTEAESQSAKTAAAA
jgi:phytoene dehydrogenase-like protein